MHQFMPWKILMVILRVKKKKNERKKRLLTRNDFILMGQGSDVLSAGFTDDLTNITEIHRKLSLIQEKIFLSTLVQANTFCRLGCDISLKLFPNRKWKYGENSLKYLLLCRPKTEKRSIRKLNETARLNLWITANSWFFKQMMRRTVNRLEAKQNGNSFYTVWHLNCFERSTGRQSFVSFYWKIVFVFKDLREERDGGTKSFNMCVKKSFPLRCIVVQVNLF